MNYETSFRSDETATPIDGDSAPRRRRALIIGAVVVVLAVALAFFMFGRKSEPAGPIAAPSAKAQAPEVTVVTPGRQPVAGTVSATGTMAARVDMPVGVAGEGGEVTRVLVQPGDWVRAGQVLATIERSVQAQQSAALQAQINVARANARLAEQELARAQQLVGRGFISKADVDRKLATRDQANAQVRVAEAQYRESLARTGRLDIRAPAAGLVLTRAVEPGQVVGAGSGALFRLAKGGEMERRAQVAPVIDPQSRQGIARIALSYDPALRPGGFAQAEIVTGQTDAPVLPESAVLSDPNGNYVYVVDANDKAQRRAVKTGQVSAKGIAIVSGLTGNEQVVLSAGAFLNPGQAVKPHRQAAGR